MGILVGQCIYFYVLVIELMWMLCNFVVIVFFSWWQHAANLASYEQQDAHEFFISMLDGIHEKVDKDKRKPNSQGKFITFFCAHVSYLTWKSA